MHAIELIVSFSVALLSGFFIKNITTPRKLEFYMSYIAHSYKTLVMSMDSSLTIIHDHL